MNYLRFRRPVLTSLLTMLVVTAITMGIGLGAVPLVQAREIVGNTYTSPQFGFSLTWDSSWSVIGEETGLSDRIELTNGISFVRVFGGPLMGGDALLAGTVLAASVSQDPSVSNVVVGESGGDSSRYWVNLTLTVTLSDGTPIPITQYIEVRTLVPGESVVVFDGYGNSAYAVPARAAFDKLLTGLVIPEVRVQLQEGEPAPIFMAGPWRVAIVAAAMNARLPGIGLSEKEGKQWVAVVADVTNWGSSDPAFPFDEFSVEMIESTTPHSVATGSTASAARELGLTAGAETEIEYGETGRVVMVFSVNADRTEPALVFGRDRLPLDDFLLFDLDRGDLTALAGPPELQLARLDSISEDGETLEVRYEGESRTHRLTLLGVDVSETTSAAVEALSEFEGEFIWIETDPAVESTGTASVYLWFDNNRGDRVMINQMLIEEGAAQYAPLPDDARFAAWLEATAALVTDAD